MRLAQKAVDLGEPEYFRPYFHVTHALAAYRKGWFAVAVESAGKGLSEKPPDPNIHALAYTLIAMSDFRLGEIQEARTNLAKAVEIQQHRDTIQESGFGNDPRQFYWRTDYWQDWWHDWLITQIIIREAESLIEGPPAESPK